MNEKLNAWHREIGFLSSLAVIVLSICNIQQAFAMDDK